MFNVEAQTVVTNRQGQNRNAVNQAEGKSQRHKHRNRREVDIEEAINEATESKKTPGQELVAMEVKHNAHTQYEQFR